MEHQTIVVAAVAFVAVTTWLCIIGGLALWIQRVLQQPKTVQSQQQSRKQSRRQQPDDNRFRTVRVGLLVLTLYRTVKGAPEYGGTVGKFLANEGSKLKLARTLPIAEWRNYPQAFVEACHHLEGQPDIDPEDVRFLVDFRETMTAARTMLEARQKQQANGVHQQTDASVAV